MIRCTPWYTLSYKGVFYKAGEAFTATGADREELSRHGSIEDLAEPEEEQGAMEVLAEEEQVTMEEAPPEKKPGRPRKQEARDG